MTFGEMKFWTDRFNQIRGAAQSKKDERLNNMFNDLVLAHDSLDKHARQIYLSVLDEMKVSQC